MPHLALGATVPGAHWVAAVLPRRHAVPAGHAEQASADLSPWLPLYEPARLGLGLGLGGGVGLGLGPGLGFGLGLGLG